MPYHLIMLRQLLGEVLVSFTKKFELEDGCAECTGEGLNMFKVHCMNNISKVGTNRLGDRYEFTSELADANAILVRSARLHDIELPKELLGDCTRRCRCK